MNSKVVLSTILFSLFVFQSCNAQSSFFEIMTFPEEMKNVSMVVEDSHGLWFGQYYNGLTSVEKATKKMVKYKFMNFHQFDFITCFESINEELWVGLYNRGIAVFNREISNFVLNNPTEWELTKDYIRVTDIITDGSKVWVGTWGQGLYWYDIKNKEWHRTNLRNDNIISIALNRNFVVVATSRGIFISKDNGIWSIVAPISKGFRLLNLVLINDEIYANIHQGLETRILKFNHVEKRFEALLSLNGLVYLAAWEQYLVLSSGKGLAFYHPGNKQIKRIRVDSMVDKNGIGFVSITQNHLYFLNGKQIYRTEIQKFSKQIDELKSEKITDGIDFPSLYKQPAALNEISEMVKYGDKIGFATKSGEVLIEPQFDDAFSFQEGMAAVNIGGQYVGRWGYINHKGELIIDFKYDKAWPFSEGLARVKLGDDWFGKYGYINQQGMMVIPAIFYSAEDFKGGYAKVKLKVGSTEVLIDRRGSVVTQPK